MQSKFSIPCLAPLATALIGIAGSTQAIAENHALIMTVDYRGTSAALPGIDKDANLAKKIALAMGVPAKNIVDVRNQELTHQGMSRAIRALNDRIAAGDKVFLYYSGHGTQEPSSGSDNKCSEGMVSADLRIYYDSQLQSDLDALAAKSSQVVMMNDSCFSGGQATKDFASSSEVVPKFYRDSNQITASNSSGYTCGEAVNKMGRTLEVSGRERGTNVLYVAASADNEVSGATPSGSVGTLAWASCVGSSSADSDRSGTISGQELRACAQSWINTNRAGRQTISLVGNTKLPVYFGQGTADTSGGAPAPVVAVNTLNDIRAASDPALRVNLNPASNSLRIRQDEIDMSVSTNRPGYLYILQVGSDGKTFNLLFPNRLDTNNYIDVGNHRFPRDTWRVRAGGPAGSSYLLAVVSPVKRNFSKDMDTSGTFASGEADNDFAKTLYAETVGANASGSGRYGASTVVQIRETN